MFVFLYQTDVSVLLSNRVSRDGTLAVASLGSLTEVQQREAMEKKVLGEFGSSMKEWKVRGEITSNEGYRDVSVLVLRGIQTQPVVVAGQYIGHEARPI